MFAIAAGPSAIAKVNGQTVDEFDSKDFIYVLSDEEFDGAPLIEDTSNGTVYSLYVYNEDKDRLLLWGDYSKNLTGVSSVHIAGTYVTLETDEEIEDIFDSIKYSIQPNFIINGDWIQWSEEEEEE